MRQENKKKNLIELFFLCLLYVMRKILITFTQVKKFFKLLKSNSFLNLPKSSIFVC